MKLISGCSAGLKLKASVGACHCASEVVLMSPIGSQWNAMPCGPNTGTCTFLIYIDIYVEVLQPAFASHFLPMPDVFELKHVKP